MKTKNLAITILWILPIIFFLLLIFGAFKGLFTGERSVLEMIIPLIATIGATIWAWVISKKHYPRIKDKIGKPITILFIPLTYLYGILFETSFNYGRFLREGFWHTFMEHMTFHIFNDTLVMLISFFVVWLVFRKINIGKWTFFTAFIVAIIFQFFLTTTVDDIELGERIFFGLFWVWLFYVNWYIVSLLLRPEKIDK